MGQVQNGSRKNEAEECKKLTYYMYIPLLLYAKSNLEVPLTLTRWRKPNMKISIFFHLLSFFLSSSSHITQKLYGVCESYTYQMTTLLVEIIPTCFELHVRLFLIIPTYRYIVKVCKVHLQLLFSCKVSHDPLKKCHSISYPERYACELIQCMTFLNSSVWPVTLFDAELVVQ